MTGESWATLERALVERGARCFLRSPDGEMSGREALAALRREPLDRLELPDGEVVPVLVDTSAVGVLALLALWSRGCVPFPLPPREPPGRLAELCRAARCGPALVPRDGWTEVPGTQTGQRTTLPGAATVLGTSGSTGEPKLVVHALRQHLASARAAAHALDLSSEDSWLLALPLHHVGGLAPVFRALVSGAVLVVSASGEALGAGLQRVTPTHVSLVATQLARCLGDEGALRALARAKVVLGGGGPFPTELRRRAVASGVPLVVSYGSTETASLVTAERDPARVVQPGCAGAPLAGRQLRVDGDGQILVAGDTLLSGYLEAGALRDPRRADGWFATGDLGHLDEDGRLFVEGRLDRMLVSGGENVDPAEIERALLACPAVSEALVVAVPDPEFGARPVAFVRCAPDHTTTAAALAAHLETRLARYKVPDRFWRLRGDEPPDRARLQRLAADPDAGLEPL